MRDCPNVEMRERLPDLLHGVLRADVAASVRAHVAECADCRAELALLERIRSVLVTPGAAIDTTRIVSKLPAYQRPSLWLRATRSSQLRAAAAIVLLVGGFAIVRGTRTDAPAIDSAVAVAPSSEISIGDTFQDLTDNDLRAMLDEITKLEAVTPASTDDDVPAVIDRSGPGGSGGTGGTGGTSGEAEG